MNNNTNELTALQTIAYVSHSLPTGYRFAILAMLISWIGFCCLVRELPSIMHEMPRVIEAIKETNPSQINEMDSVKTTTYVTKGYVAAKKPLSKE